MKYNIFIFLLLLGFCSSLKSQVQMGADFLNPRYGMAFSEQGEFFIAGKSSGVVESYTWNNTEWVIRANDVPGDSHALDMNSNGTRFVAGGYSESVKIYEFQNNQWVQLGQTINGVEAWEGFGRAVAMNQTGDRIIVSAPESSGKNNNNGREGKIRVFELQNNSWVQIGSTVDGTYQYDHFGRSVAISADGNTIAVGANTGSYVRVFDFVNGDWEQRGSDLQGTGNFGWSVALDDSGDRLVVAACPAGFILGEPNVLVFDYSNQGWSEEAAFADFHDIGSKQFEVDISSDGRRVVYGDRIYHPDGTYVIGLLETYDRIGSDWVKIVNRIVGTAQIESVGSRACLSGNGERLGTFVNGYNGNQDALRTYDLTQIVIGLTMTGDSISCFANNTGSVSVSVCAGYEPYSYNWSNGSTSNSIDNLAPGLYHLTVTDDEGFTGTGSYEVMGSPELEFSIDSQINIECPGDNTGSIDISVNGGLPPYEYIWSNGSTSSTLENLSAGTYTVTVTDIINCEIIESLTLSEPGPFAVTIDNDGGGICPGSSLVLEAIVTGENPPYNYLWSTGSTAPSITAFNSGSYSVTVTDNTFCTADTITQIISHPFFSISISSTDETVPGGEDGTASVNIDSGNSSYTYEWSNGSTTQSISDLASGDYMVTVTDIQSLCTLTDLVSIQSANCDIQVVLNSPESACENLSDLVIEASISGGTEPYSFIWSNGSTEQNLIEVSCGSYSLTVTDAEGCVLSEETSIVCLDVIDFDLQSDTINCFNTSACVDIISSASTSSYTIEWFDGSNDAVLCGLGQGDYSVAVTSADGCLSLAEFTVMEIDSMSIILDLTNETEAGANDGGAEANVSGGLAPFQFTWSTGDTTTSISNLMSGAYSLTVVDAQGCIKEVDFPIEIGVLPYEITLIPGDFSCSNFGNGDISVEISPVPTETVNYLWSNNEITNNIPINASGMYCVTVSIGSTFSESACLTVSYPDSLLLQVDEVKPSIENQNNGSINVSITGGTPYQMNPQNYNVEWYNIYNELVGTEEDISNLPPGEYHYIVSDSLDCSICCENIRIGTITSVHSPTENIDVSVFPNPIQSNLNIYFNLGLAGNYDISLINPSGRIIDRVYLKNWNESLYQWKQEKLHAGIYFLVVSDGMTKVTKKIVKLE